MMAQLQKIATFCLCATRKEFKLRFHGGDCGINKCKGGCNGAYGVVWRRLRLAGV